MLRHENETSGLTSPANCWNVGSSEELCSFQSTLKAQKSTENRATSAGDYDCGYHDNNFIESSSLHQLVPFWIRVRVRLFVYVRTFAKITLFLARVLSLLSFSWFHSFTFHRLSNRFKNSERFSNRWKSCTKFLLPQSQLIIKKLLSRCFVAYV